VDQELADAAAYTSGIKHCTVSMDTYIFEEQSGQVLAERDSK